MSRLIPAAIFLPILYVIVQHLSPWAFFVLVAAAVLVAQYEFYRLYFERRDTVACGLLLGFLVVASVYQGNPLSIQAALTVAVAIVMLFTLALKVRGDTLATAMNDMAILLFGVVYIGWLLSYVIVLRAPAKGSLLMLFLFLVTWGGDAAAYYVGRAMGRHPLAPQISPKKTVEGAVGGLVGSVGLALLGRSWWLPALPLVDALVLGMGLGVLGQAGDLAESLLKRSAGVKDSGRLIPAHGGVLDKVDSLLFTAPALHYYLLWRGYGQAFHGL